MFKQPVKPQTLLIKPGGLCESLALVTSHHKSPFPGDLSLPPFSFLSHSGEGCGACCGWSLAAHGAGPGGFQQGFVPSSLGKGSGLIPPWFPRVESQVDWGVPQSINVELKPLPPAWEPGDSKRDTALRSSSLGTKFGADLNSLGAPPRCRGQQGLWHELATVPSRAGHWAQAAHGGNGEETAGLGNFPPLKQTFPGRGFANPSSQAEFLHLSPNRDFTPDEFTAPAPGLG